MTAARATLFSCLLLAGCNEVTADPDAAPTDPGDIFCFAYDDACGFGNDFGGAPYANRSECVSRFDGFNEVQRSCVQEYVAFAAEGDQAGNCPSAEGGAPCDPDSTFCAQYDLICGFGNGFGGTPFVDMADCQTRYDAFTAERQMCVQQHLGFAEEDAMLHCPHVAGAPPCD